jgi:hypothetical protein
MWCIIGILIFWNLLLNVAIGVLFVWSDTLCDWMREVDETLDNISITYATNNELQASYDLLDNRIDKHIEEVNEALER